MDATRLVKSGFNNYHIDVKDKKSGENRQGRCQEGKDKIDRGYKKRDGHRNNVLNQIYFLQARQDYSRSICASKLSSLFSLSRAPHSQHISHVKPPQRQARINQISSHHVNLTPFHPMFCFHSSVSPRLIVPGTAYYKVATGDNCFKLMTTFGNFTLADFYSWNPDVGNDCSNLLLNYYVCINGGKTTPTGTPTSTPSKTSTSVTPTSTCPAEPSPVQPGIVNCCTYPS